MIVFPATAIDVISDLAGSSENCAAQERPALSLQLTTAESDVARTWIEALCPLISKVTLDCAVNSEVKRTATHLSACGLLEVRSLLGICKPGEVRRVRGFRDLHA